MIWCLGRMLPSLIGRTLLFPGGFGPHAHALFVGCHRCDYARRLRCRGGSPAVGAAADRYSTDDRRAARLALQAGWRRPVSHRDRAAWLRRIGGARRGDSAALSRLGGAIAEGGQRGAAARQLWLARTRSAMPHQRQGAPRSGPPRTGGRYPRRAAMAAAAALGVARSDRPGRMGERRQRRAVGGAAATAVEGRSGFPLGGGVLSGLPAVVWPRMERTSSDAGADRRQRRSQFAGGVPPDDRRRARTQRAGPHRGLSRRLSRIRPPQSSAHAASGNTDASAPERGHLGADPDARADSQKRVAEWLAR